MGSDGSIYGTTSGEVTSGTATPGGSVYKIDPTGVFATLHTFADNEANNNPRDGVAVAADGTVYGTVAGTTGNNPVGTLAALSTNGLVYKISPTGVYSVLHDFNYTNEAYPLFNITLGDDGSVYGVTAWGGGCRYGTRANPIGICSGTWYKIDANGNYKQLTRFRQQFGEGQRRHTVWYAEGRQLSCHRQDSQRRQLE